MTATLPLEQVLLNHLEDCAFGCNTSDTRVDPADNSRLQFPDLLQLREQCNAITPLLEQYNSSKIQTVSIRLQKAIRLYQLRVSCQDNYDLKIGQQRWVGVRRFILSQHGIVKDGRGRSVGKYKDHMDGMQEEANCAQVLLTKLATDNASLSDLITVQLQCTSWRTQVLQVVDYLKSCDGQVAAQQVVDWWLSKPTATSPKVLCDVNENALPSNTSATSIAGLVQKQTNTDRPTTTSPSLDAHHQSPSGATRRRTTRSSLASSLSPQQVELELDVPIVLVARSRQTASSTHAIPQQPKSSSNSRGRSRQLQELHHQVADSPLKTLTSTTHLRALEQAENPSQEFLNSIQALCQQTTLKLRDTEPLATGGERPEVLRKMAALIQELEDLIADKLLTARVVAGGVPSPANELSHSSPDVVVANFMRQTTLDDILDSSEDSDAEDCEAVLHS